MLMPPFYKKQTSDGDQRSSEKKVGSPRERGVVKNSSRACAKTRRWFCLEMNDDQSTGHLQGVL